MVIYMGLFSKSANEEIIDKVYALVTEASESLIQAEGVKKHRDEILKRAEVLFNGEQLDQMTDSLIKYAISLTCYSHYLLSLHSSIRCRPFMNMAIQRKLEEEIVSSCYSDNAKSIIMDVEEFNGRGFEGLCPAEVLSWIVLKK